MKKGVITLLIFQLKAKPVIFRIIIDSYRITLFMLLPIKPTKFVMIDPTAFLTKKINSQILNKIILIKAKI